MIEGWPWTALVLLGAFHGLNPAMGWLFAVALGLQERRRGAVLAALPPIALGHAASVAVVVAVIAAAGQLAEPRTIRVGAGIAILAFGLFKLARPLAHPRWVGMRVGFRDLVLWSFLMSSAHGAGLMLVPVMLGGRRAGHALEGPGIAMTGLAALVIHTLALFAVMGAVAVLMYEIVGLALLRRAWINIDLLWAAVLVGAGLWVLVAD